MMIESEYGKEWIDVNTNHRAYYLKHREAILKRAKERQAIRKTEIKRCLALKQQGRPLSKQEEELLFTAHLQYINHCHKAIGIYAYRSMDRDRAVAGSVIDTYYERYPFEQYAEPYIRRELRNHLIGRTMAEYDECYDAGMLAYLYSIHRCAALRCGYAPSYIRKMIRIFVSCAGTVHRDEASPFCMRARRSYERIALRALS